MSIYLFQLGWQTQETLTLKNVTQFRSAMFLSNTKEKFSRSSITTKLLSSSSMPDRVNTIYRKDVKPLETTSINGAKSHNISHRTANLFWGKLSFRRCIIMLHRVALSAQLRAWKRETKLLKPKTIAAIFFFDYFSNHNDNG